MADETTSKRIRLIPGPVPWYIGNITIHEGVVYRNVKARVFRTCEYPEPDPIVIGVFGSSYQGHVETDKKRKEKLDEAAFNIGMGISNYKETLPNTKKHRQMVMLTGACPGYPHIAAEGARECSKEIFIVGITAADAPETHLEMLQTTLNSKSEAEKLYARQREVYNLIIFPEYSLPKASVKVQQAVSKISEENKDKFTGEEKKLFDGICRSFYTLSSDLSKNMLKWRNPLNTELSDAAIAIGGSAGTLSELAMAYHPNHAIIGLYTLGEGEPTLTDFFKQFHDKIGILKNTDQKVIYSSNPNELVTGIAKAYIEREKAAENFYSFLKGLENKSEKDVEKNINDMIEQQMKKNKEELIKYVPSSKLLRTMIIEPLQENMRKWQSESL